MPSLLQFICMTGDLVKAMLDCSKPIIAVVDGLAGSNIGWVYRQVIGRHFPAMSLVQVADLLEEGAKVEIEVTAVVPN